MLHFSFPFKMLFINSFGKVMNIVKSKNLNILKRVFRMHIRPKRFIFYVYILKLHIKMIPHDSNFLKSKLFYKFPPAPNAIKLSIFFQCCETCPNCHSHPPAINYFLILREIVVQAGGNDRS